MSISLAINTATAMTEIAVLRDNEVLKEDSWPAEANESDRILPYLRDTLQELGLAFTDIDELFIVKGPGHFTALRVGIAIVNTLAFLLKLPIYTIDTFEMVSLRSDLETPHYVLLPSGGKNVFWDRFPDRLDTPQIGDSAPSDLPHAEIKLRFGETISHFDKKEKKDIVEPLYIKPPNISKPKK